VEISALDEPSQLAALQKVIVAISKLDDGFHLEETKTLLRHLNSIPSMAARSTLLDTVAEHLKSLSAGKHYSEEFMRNEENEHVVVSSLLHCLDLLEPPQLRIRPLLTITKLSMGMDEDSLNRLNESILAVRIADIPCKQLHEWLGVLRFFSFHLTAREAMTLELEGVINAFRDGNELSHSERLELLSMLLSISGFSEGNERLIREDLVPSLVPGQALDVVARNVAHCVLRAQDGRHLASLADYIEGAPAEQQAELSVMVLNLLEVGLDRMLRPHSMEPQALSQYFLTSVRLLSRLPEEERPLRATQAIAFFEDALNGDREIYQFIHALPRQTKLEAVEQIENVLSSLEKCPQVNYALLQLLGIREALS